MTAQPPTPLEILDAVLAALASDFALSHAVAETFWRQAALDVDAVDATWRKYWGRGLHDEE